MLHITAKRYLQDFIGSPPLFAPGQGAEYSDPGYFLLGMIVEKASGLPYRDFMQQRVFDTTFGSTGFAAPYSYRKATTGATLVARRAGTKVATSATAASTSATPMKVSGSPALTP